jgi:hypothetical protein
LKHLESEAKRRDVGTEFVLGKLEANVAREIEETRWRCTLTVGIPHSGQDSLPREQPRTMYRGESVTVARALSAEEGAVQSYNPARMAVA